MNLKTFKVKLELNLSKHVNNCKLKTRLPTPSHDNFPFKLKVGSWLREKLTKFVFCCSAEASGQQDLHQQPALGGQVAGHQGSLQVCGRAPRRPITRTGTQVINTGNFRKSHASVPVPRYR